jgi:hypothetical protein
MLKSLKKNLGYKALDNMINESEKLRLQITELNNMKNESLYVSIKNEDFQSPEEVINKDKCNTILGRALILVGEFKGFIQSIEINLNKIAKSIKESE